MVRPALNRTHRGPIHCGQTHLGQRDTEHLTEVPQPVGVSGSNGLASGNRRAMQQLAGNGMRGARERLGVEIAPAGHPQELFLAELFDPESQRRDHRTCFPSRKSFGKLLCRSAGNRRPGRKGSGQTRLGDVYKRQLSALFRR